MNDSFPNRSIDPELEARIVDMVLGEASDVERERLQLLIDNDIELQSFKEQIQSVHGLLREAGTGEFSASQEDWKLSDTRRSSLLTVLTGAEQKETDQPDAGGTSSTKSKVQRTNSKTVRTDLDPKNPAAWRFTRYGALAASLAAVGLLIVIVPQLTLQMAARRDAGLPAMLNSIASEESDASIIAEAPASRPYATDADGEAIRRYAGRMIAGTEMTHEVQPSLPTPYYLEDDVQYFPKKDEFKLAKEAGILTEKRKSAESGPAVDKGTRAKGLTVPGTTTASVPEGGSLLLGGIRRDGDSTTREQGRYDAAPTRLFADPQRRAGQTSSNQNGTILSITPRIIIAEEEEAQTGWLTDIDRSMVMPDTELSMHFSRERDWQELADNSAVDKKDAPDVSFTLDFGKQQNRDSQRQEKVAEVEQLGEKLERTELMRGLTNTPVPASIEEADAASEPFSTFSLHVGDVSFKLAQAALARGEWPDASKIRIEEFVNALDYGDPLPREGEAVTCTLEQSTHPFLQRRNLVRISMRTAAAGRAANMPLRLTFLLDNSGSMERVDRRQTVRSAFELLIQQLQPNDQVTLISFARQPRLLADRVPGSEAGKLLDAIQNMPSEGGTNIEAALQLAFEKAQEQKVENSQNRIVMLTDGAVNLGDANPERLSGMIESMRNAGIAFDAAGISAEGLNDEILEALTRKGDGRYYLIGSPDDADESFAKQIAGALRPSAKNVKVQVEFNPERVGRYKLLGFEKHRLNTEDFRNDAVDAAEMSANEAGVAVYQVELKPDGTGDIGSASVRFQDLSTGQMVEHRWPIPYRADTPTIYQAEHSMRIATAAALFAAKLSGEPLGEYVDLTTLSKLITTLPESARRGSRVGELQVMIQQARELTGSGQSAETR